MTTICSIITGSHEKKKKTTHLLAEESNSQIREREEEIAYRLLTLCLYFS